MSNNGNPKVSIGMPVFNGEATVCRAIESILAQSHRDFVLIISDNASTDLTADQCARYCRSDSRIRYLRQEVNIGAARNFQAVLESANDKYFMWAAADDWWHPEFIERNLANLVAHPEAIASISNVLLDGKKYNEADSGVSQLIGSPQEKILLFCRQPGANSRFYSLFKIEALREIRFDREYIAADWSAIIDLINTGDMITLIDYYGLDRSMNGAGSAAKRFSNNRAISIEFVLPYFEFSRHALSNSPAVETILYLARLNFRANLERLKLFFGT